MNGSSYLLSRLSECADFSRLKSAVEGGEGPCSAFGVSGSAAAYIIAALNDDKRQMLIIAPGDAQARALYDALKQLTGGAEFLPAREIQLTNAYASSRELSAKRVRALGGITTGKKRLLVTTAEAAMQLMTPPEEFICAQIELNDGETLAPEALVKKLALAGYERVDRAEGEGQFRFSGGILDVYPAGSDYPARIEFFDDEIDSIRSYDPSDQRSRQKLKSVCIPPATEAPVSRGAAERGYKAFEAIAKEGGRLSSRADALAHAFKESGHASGAEQLLPFLFPGAYITDYFDRPYIVLLEPNEIAESARTAYGRFIENFTSRFEDGGCFTEQSGLMADEDKLSEMLDSPRTLCFSQFARSFEKLPPKQLFKFDLRAASQYGGNIEALASDVKTLKARGTAVVLYAGARAKALGDMLLDFGLETAAAGTLARLPEGGEALLLQDTLPAGFESLELKLSVFSDIDIYGTRKRAAAKHSKRSVNKMDIFADLKIGDYVVHQLHGIGVFKGFCVKTADGVSRDYMAIQYQGADKLYVPIDQLDRVQKFIGAADRQPRVNKLGGGEWGKAVTKVRASVKELAIDLVKLYAQRKLNKGYAFAPDSIWQKQLEDAFPYEETPDQLQCIDEIKQDMESGIVMDRLLCGDVGYGKTEVALRAAFKAVQDSKQVAFLVPTTVLAQQHFHTLSSRYAGFPVNVRLMSRFTSPAMQKETLKKLKTGECDVIIGTHRLLGKDVKFKDLGLLIIDEEQRFGVGHKEQIKDLRQNIDVLTLSATPIPRTLHMAMTGIRDMSVIETPPEERYPVQTYVMEFSNALAREAILKERARGGQTYFLYNNVKDMERFAGKLRELIPEVSIAEANGQMPENALESTMVAFMEGEYDVLLCSTIIESGLDIPNVNTIIVYDSDRLGLSQLYQLRGRVGRTNRAAYAYLTFQKDKVLTEVAQKRLSAIREFTEFGSGFKIAMRDLEIRGAGNLLGAQQHGHMDAVGYDMYCKLVEEAVQEAMGKKVRPDIDTQMDVKLEARVPEGYISDERLRLETYKRIASISSRQEMYDVQEEIEDRFGDIPRQVQNLMDIAMLRSFAQNAQLERVWVDEAGSRAMFAPTADIDGGKLIALVTNTPGAALRRGGMELTLKGMSGSVEQNVSCFAGLIQKIYDCNNDAEIV